MRGWGRGEMKYWEISQDGRKGEGDIPSYLYKLLAVGYNVKALSKYITFTVPTHPPRNEPGQHDFLMKLFWLFLTTFYLYRSEVSKILPMELLHSAYGYPEVSRHLGGREMMATLIPALPVLPATPLPKLGPCLACEEPCDLNLDQKWASLTPLPRCFTIDFWMSHSINFLDIDV